MNKLFNYRPLTLLPKYLELSQEALSGAKQQIKYLLSCKERPYVLDEQTIQRIIKACNDQLNSVDFYKEQFKNWRQQSSDEQQLSKIAIAENITKQLTEINQQTKELIEKHFKHRTIESMLKKDDIELALDFLKGKV